MTETINPDGTSVLIEAVYYRYFSIYVEECDTVEDAQAFLDGGEDCGSLSSVGVYVDGEPHSCGPWEWHPPTSDDENRSLEYMRERYAEAKNAR